MASTVPVALAQPATTATPGGAPYPQCAAGTQVSQADSDKAHNFYTTGKVKYDENNFDGAIADFRESYSRDCTRHELLVIISRAYEGKGDKAEAIRALETYLQRVPNAPEASTYRARIDKLKKDMADKPPPAASSSAPVASSTATTAPSSTSTTPPPPEGPQHSMVPWVVTGAGGVALVAGVVLMAVGAGGVPSNCTITSQTCTRTPAETLTSPTDPDKSTKNSQFTDDENKAGQGATLFVTGIVVGVIGLGATIGGLIWHFSETPSNGASASADASKGRIQVLPSFSPNYAGASVGGTF